MIIIICDNCGEKGNNNYIGELCEKCHSEYLKEREKVDATKSVLELQLKKKFHVK